MKCYVEWKHILNFISYDLQKFFWGSFDISAFCLSDIM